MSDVPLIPTPAAAKRAGLSESTFTKMRVRGDGPPYFVVGRKKIFYDPTVVDAWARARRHRSTSEYTAQHVAAS